ncbi:MAG: response regulator transcription factor [Sulfurospirillum sp.]|nr:response regulator transcription factor [Sulfurospirillum sp.]
MKILLLEDNERLSALMKEALVQKGYHVDHFNDGKKALEVIDNGYNCFILDINVPGIDGLSFLGQVRMMDTKTPAIIISANVELESIQDAYKKGCDDYLKKPFYMYELEMKLEKICKIQTSYIMFKGGYSFDLIYEKLYDCEKNEIKIAKKEILLLELLCTNLHKVVSFEMIEQHVWEGELTSMENIRALIKRLRKKLPACTIASQGGVGYELQIV